MVGASPGELSIETLAPHHDRASFSCGIDSLDAYLQRQASQDMRRKANAVFVLVDRGAPAIILGYYTLCACGLPPGEIPEAARKHIPRYPQVSATLIGRLAISADRQGHGLGRVLLVHALRKAYENASIVGSCMIVVDALDDRAARFYLTFGFMPFGDTPRLILPMRTVAALMSE